MALVSVLAVLWIFAGAAVTYGRGVEAIADGACDRLLALPPEVGMLTFVVAALIAIPLMPIWAISDLITEGRC